MLMRIAIVSIALLVGGWLSFDGTRALVQGDYTTAGSGRHAGHLGPWATLVAACGLNPRGTPVKWLHVLLGAGWLLGAMLWWQLPQLGQPLLVASAVCSLWYLPLGTVLAGVELVLLSW